MKILNFKIEGVVRVDYHEVIVILATSDVVELNN